MAAAATVAAFSASSCCRQTSPAAARAFSASSCFRDTSPAAARAAPAVSSRRPSRIRMFICTATPPLTPMGYEYVPAFKVHDVGHESVESLLQLTPKLLVFSFKTKCAYQSYAELQSEHEGCIFIPPFDHSDVITSQGTIGIKIVRPLQGPHATFVPVGGGGLSAGIAAYAKPICPEVKIIGVEPSDANFPMALSLCRGQRVMLEHVGGIADGGALEGVWEEKFRLCQEPAHAIFLPSRGAICASIKDKFEAKISLHESAGALTLAGVEVYCKYYGLKGETVAAITNGTNMNFDRFRLVTELVDVGGAGNRDKSTAVMAMPIGFVPGGLVAVLPKDRPYLFSGASLHHLMASFTAPSRRPSLSHAPLRQEICPRVYCLGPAGCNQPTSSESPLEPLSPYQKVMQALKYVLENLSWSATSPILLLIGCTALGYYANKGHPRASFIIDLLDKSTKAYKSTFYFATLVIAFIVSVFPRR